MGESFWIGPELGLCMLFNFNAFVDFSIKYNNKKSFRNTQESNNLDPDQDRHSVGTDLGPNCLQRLS